MRRFRFHLGTLVILVLVLGVGFAAFRESNEVWDSITFSITLSVLLTSILLAVHRTEKRRAYWLGFSLFGAAYLGLTLVPPIETRLITTKTLTFIDSKVPRSSPVAKLIAVAGFATGQPNALYLNKGNGTFRRWVRGTVGTTENFVRIGHSFLALIVAFVGGQLSRHLYGNERERVEGSVIPETSNSGGSGD